ncbi:outer membrane lipoprotein-sorting protein [Candidatus Margulisiibacteriota bacterium]
MKFSICLFFVSCVLVIPVMALTADQIIDRVDQNMNYISAQYNGKMIIHIGDEVREKKMVSYSKGRTKAFTEFLSPARDKGTRYLKMDDNMWMYLPSVEKVIKIAGHMLRQSMMGSDFSYEDALEAIKLREKYSARVTGSDKFDGRDCYLLDLIAKVKQVTYYRRKIWIDKKMFIGLKEELYAKSGKLLKVATATDIKRFGKRNYPTKMVIKNMLRKNSYTEFLLTNIKFDIMLADDIFTLRNLKRGVK